MNIQLKDHFTFRKLILFTLPSIGMMIFTSIYGVVDGIFVSNFAGKEAFAAVNLIMPACMITGALGFMIGTGGSALVARMMGEGDQARANRTFSMLIWVSVILGALVSLLGCIFIRPIAIALGAEGDMIEYCAVYGRILMMATVPFILQNEFQSFLVVAEKPQFGLVITVLAGCTNIVLDALFVGALDGEIVGAAWATVISQIVGSCIPLGYFLLSKKSSLRLTKPTFDFRSLAKACTNGSSEMMSNLSMSLVSMLYNFQLMKLAQDTGVAAYGVIMYVNFIFVAIFIGYSVGSAPIISFHYGAQNHDELKSLRKKSLGFVGACAVCMTIAGVAFSGPLAKLFAGSDVDFYNMTRRGMMLYSLSFLFSGLNIFASSFFTALNNGLISAIISFLRTLVFQVAAIMVLPKLLDLDGIWLSVAFAEILALAISFALMRKMQARYQY